MFGFEGLSPFCSPDVKLALGRFCFAGDYLKKVPFGEKMVALLL